MLNTLEILSLGHRMASVYKHDHAGPGQHLYQFEPHTLVDFANAIAKAVLEQHRAPPVVMPTPAECATFQATYQQVKASPEGQAAAQWANGHAADAINWQPLLDAVMREIPHRNRGGMHRGNGPGHGHSVAGIWDSDNGALAGKPCAWCLAWNTAKAALARQGEQDAQSEAKDSKATLETEQPAGRWEWIDRGPVWVGNTCTRSAPDAWREVMAEMADDIECEAKNTYVSRDQYPSEMRKFKASTAIVERARALLDEHAAVILASNDPAHPAGSVLAWDEPPRASVNVPDAAVAAIQFALLQGLECETFLRLWNEGEFEVILTEWPDCPPAVFIGADPLMPSQETPAEGASASTLMDDLDTVLAHDLSPPLNRIHVLIEGEYYSAKFLLNRVREVLIKAQLSKVGTGGVR